MCTFANVAILTCTWALWWVQSVSVQAPVWLWHVHRWHLWFLPSPTVVWHKSAQNRNMSITGVTKAVLDKMLPKKRRRFAQFERGEHLCQPEMRNWIIHKHQEVRVQRKLDRKGRLIANKIKIQLWWIAFVITASWVTSGSESSYPLQLLCLKFHLLLQGGEGLPHL